MPTIPSVSVENEPQTADYHLIKSKIPVWLTQASAPTREAFRRTSTGHVDWLNSLAESERQQLEHYSHISARSQNAVEQAMAQLLTAEAFAKPLLAAAIKEQFSIEPDLDATFLELRNPIALGALGIEVGSFSVLTLSLLQAALHNFEVSEAQPGAFSSTSRFKSGPAAHAPALSLGISIERFIGLCRCLDIGEKYQAHLRQFFLSATGLREQVMQAQKDALQAAACLALLKQDIEPDDYAMIGSVIAETPAIFKGGKPVWFNDLSIMGLSLSGCTVFVPVEKHQPSNEVLVYVPHDPEHPLKKYASHQGLETELTRQLMAEVTGKKAGSGPGRYQQFFSNFVAYTDQPTFWRRLTQDAAGVKEVPGALVNIGLALLPFVSPMGNNLLGPKQLPPPPSVREPIKDPNFNIRVVAKREPWADNVELWSDNFDKLRDKLVADARGHAVPTADVDAKVRARKIAALESVGLFALNLVSMFVPGLGEVMMGVMVAQLLYETFEGVVEWKGGDREAALEHLTDVAENLAFVAVMAAGGAGVRKALKTPAIVEGTRPVISPGGKQKLWRADLTPYKAAVQLPPDAKPDALGLYTHEGQTILPLEGEHFAVKHDPHTADYRIQHPTRADVYAPRLTHNHDGAWQHEVEHPLTWDGPTSLRRLGHPVEGLSADRLQQVCEASGIEVDALRAGHIDNEAMPLALIDTLQRFKAADELSTFIAQMKNTAPAVYAKADIGLQMDLMRRRGMLLGLPLGVADHAGNVLWRDPAPARLARRAVLLSDEGLARGELLQEVLYTLQGEDPALSEFPGQPDDPLPERARLLREYLAEQAQSSQSTLVEERYQAQTHNDDPDVQLLRTRFATLPSAVAEHLLKNLSEEQLQAFRRNAMLPDELMTQAEWQVQEARVSRAYEGLFAESLANPDSQWLALHTVEALPGWPPGAQVELREPSAMDAAPGDLYAALWQQLTPEQARAIGAGDAVQLRGLIQRSPLPRDSLRTVLLRNPVRKPAYDASMRLLGGGRGVQQMVSNVTNVFRAPAERARRLFPSYSGDEVTAFLQSLGTDVRGGLSRLEDEYQTLKRDLDAWVGANAPQRTATAFDRQGGFVKTYADAIKRCWRRQSLTLTIDSGMPLKLPALTADFTHVHTLKLSNTPWSPEAQTFLNNFKQLKLLSISRAALTTLPEGLEHMQNLEALHLAHNRICLTPASVETLGKLGQLTSLGLSNNALGLAPDVSAMPHLKYLYLGNAGLEQWPTGLLGPTDLHEVDLSRNLLRTIPDEHFRPSPEHRERTLEINRVTKLLGNPLTPQTELELDVYWQNLAQVHPEWMSGGFGDNFAVESPSIARVRRMFPRYNTRESRVYIWGLGSNAEAEVSRLALEFDGLNEQLNTWAFTGGGARQRYVRMGRLLENAGDRDHRYIAKARIISCWRRETPTILAADRTPIGVELDLSNLNLTSLPDLDTDFGHVGSLKLKNMQLTASPEGFLSRFRGVRWLDMTNNQLRELPPALGEMHGLTRLFLDNNQIRLTADTATVLSGRITLRALWLDQNPLGFTPDLSQMTDMRSLHLNSTGIDSWPAGLGGQPSLDDINLGGNQLTTLPDHLIAPTDDQLAPASRLAAITNVRDNPFSEPTLQQVRDYAERLERAQLLQDGRQPVLINTALGLRAPTVERAAGRSFTRWTRGFTPQSTLTREAQWLALREHPGSDGFFRMLDDMKAAKGGHADMQQRVWEVIDSITEPSAESESLREEMFAWAGRPACCDRAALSFSNVEIMKMVYRAKASASDVAQAPALLKLARGLFRLDEVEKTALADIARRTDEINNNPQLSPRQKLNHIERLEEVEIRLAYRDGLKGEQELALPGQADNVQYTSLGNVTQERLDKALERIRALDNSPEELQALLSRDFWKDYVTHKYRAQFDALSKPFHEQLAGMHDRLEARQISPSVYKAQADDLQNQLGIAEATLIESLTRTEQVLNPLPGPPDTPK